MENKIIACEVKILLSKAELSALGRSKQIGCYNNGVKEGVAKLRYIAFEAIAGLETAYLKKDHSLMKQLLLTAVGTEERFISVFGKTPIIKKRAPYFQGSYIHALKVAFPECQFDIMQDFTKIPKGKGRPRLKPIVLTNKHVKRVLDKAYARLLDCLSRNISPKHTPQYWGKKMSESPDLFARNVLTVINNDRSFRKILKGTLLHREYYLKELKADPSFSINWRKALVKLLPGVFHSEEHLLILAVGFNIQLDPIRRPRFRY